jgi:phosphocarrier protein HPr
MSGAKATVTITHPTGLHARPAVRLTRLAKTFPATIRVRPLPNGTWVDAKSIVKVMALKLRTGTEIEIEAEGEAAEAAVASLGGLVTRNFDEDG